MPKVLFVEDDDKLASLIEKYLSQQGFEVEVIADGSDAPAAVLASRPDLVMLDLMLPGKDGFTICREIRSHYPGRILFLTASEDDMDHVAGIELGADDFITKPIQPRVLLARIRMLLRRQGNQPHSTDSQPRDLSYGGLTIYGVRRAVVLDQEPVSLTASEFDLLWLLASHPEEVLSRDYLYRTLRGIEYDGMDRGIDSKVATLRRKLGDSASMSTRIITVRGQGYLFAPDSWETRNTG